MKIKEPYEMTVEQVEKMAKKFPLYGGTICWETYHAARSRGLVPKVAYSVMLMRRFN